MKSMENIIKSIDRGSPLHRKAHVGDAVIAINGNKIIDVLDYKFFAYDSRLKVLRLAYGRFAGSAEFDDFCAENKGWLEDYGLYMALKDRNKGKPWYQWGKS